MVVLKSLKYFLISLEAIQKYFRFDTRFFFTHCPQSLIVTSFSHPAKVGILAELLDILSWFFFSLSRLRCEEDKLPEESGVVA